ncbi:hypothetical protein KAR91_03865 [Candidatus Pacearchaeota archaeon]|nr:hypothetical protein [Candidatus Pacearchaeota archaeon]
MKVVTFVGSEEQLQYVTEQLSEMCPDPSMLLKDFLGEGGHIFFHPDTGLLIKRNLPEVPTEENPLMPLANFLEKFEDDMVAETISIDTNVKLHE